MESPEVVTWCWVERSWVSALLLVTGCVVKMSAGVNAVWWTDVCWSEHRMVNVSWGDRCIVDGCPLEWTLYGQDVSWSERDNHTKRDDNASERSTPTEDVWSQRLTHHVFLTPRGHDQLATKGWNKGQPGVWWPQVGDDHRLVTNRTQVTSCVPGQDAIPMSRDQFDDCDIARNMFTGHPPIADTSLSTAESSRTSPSTPSPTPPHHVALQPVTYLWSRRHPAVSKWGTRLRRQSRGTKVRSGGLNRNRRERDG